MQVFKIIFAVAIAGVVAGCSRTVPFTQNQPGPVLPQIVQPQIPAAAATDAARRSTVIADFVNDQALALMSDKDRLEAASAQFFALQFGRPGAPRRWSGDSGATGKITVGPFVRVNNLDCREFVHEVTIDQTLFEKRGTACREVDGSWRVAAAS